MSILECIIIVILIVLIFIVYLSNNIEKLISPGYSNRFEIHTDINKTFGGTDAYFKQDPRFGV